MKLQSCFVLRLALVQLPLLVALVLIQVLICLFQQVCVSDGFLHISYNITISEFEATQHIQLDIALAKPSFPRPAPFCSLQSAGSNVRFHSATSISSWILT